MKKAIAILVLGLLLSGSAFAKCINIMGTAYCSNQEDGSAINIMGNAKCTGGCVSGDPNLCEILQ
jgi:K+-transporting ATPase c subunit